MTQTKGKLSIGNKLAFGAGDIFGGGTFNLINFLFVPFLTLMLGIPMIWVSPMLLLTKIWDGIIDPFIGQITDGKTPGKYGKRRYFMLIFAPIVMVALILLFFPWNMVTDNVVVKIVLVVIMYILYATAQSFVLIPYYSLASEMSDDYNERNKTNAVRMVFSFLSSLVCVAVPGMIAQPTGEPQGYIIMASIFGVIFAVSILITALFAREQVVTPAIRHKVTLKQFFKPMKLKTYRQYVAMLICSGMSMAIMSSFFFVFCDFVLRRDSYFVLSSTPDVSRFPIATVAAAAMFLAQIAALPMYLKIIKQKSKKFAYVTSAIIWIVMAIIVIFVPAETVGSSVINNGQVVATTGVSNIVIILLGIGLGFGVGGCVLVPHSSLGDVCNVGQLHFGERTEGAFSGLTNLLNTVSQAIGLALPPLILGLEGTGRYVETQYITAEQFAIYQANPQLALQELGLSLEQFAITIGEGNVRLVPMLQSDGAQLALRLTFTVLPIIIISVGIIFAMRYKLTKERQQSIAQLIADKDSMSESQFQQNKEQLLEDLV